MAEELKQILRGTPDMVLECVRSVVEELSLHGEMYEIRRTSGTPDYARWDRTYYATCGVFLIRKNVFTGQESKPEIGTIRLQLLPEEKTLIRSLIPDNWDSPFGHFLQSLFIEFQRLGFVDFEREKPPMGFRLPHKENDVETI